MPQNCKYQKQENESSQKALRKVNSKIAGDKNNSELSLIKEELEK